MHTSGSSAPRREHRVVVHILRNIRPLCPIWLRILRPYGPLLAHGEAIPLGYCFDVIGLSIQQAWPATNSSGRGDKELRERGRKENCGPDSI